MRPNTVFEHLPLDPRTEGGTVRREILATLVLLGTGGSAEAPRPQPSTISRAEAGLELGVPAQYATIQAALDAAQPADTVQVAPGDYYESLHLRNGVHRGGGLPTVLQVPMT